MTAVAAETAAAETATEYAAAAESAVKVAAERYSYGGTSTEYMEDVRKMSGGR